MVINIMGLRIDTSWGGGGGGRGVGKVELALESSIGLNIKRVEGVTADELIDFLDTEGRIDILLELLVDNVLQIELNVKSNSYSARELEYDEMLEILILIRNNETGTDIGFSSVLEDINVEELANDLNPGEKVYTIDDDKGFVFKSSIDNNFGKILEVTYLGLGDS